MQADIAILQDHARVSRAEGQWTVADHLEWAVAEIEANRTKNVVENVGCDPASLARKYDWISRQGDGLISAADVARDMRETFGIGDQHVVCADPVFDPAITSCDPYDERPGPYYDMKKVREIEAETGIAFGVANRWAAYRREIMWLRSENKRLRQQVLLDSAMRSTVSGYCKT